MSQAELLEKLATIAADQANRKAALQAIADLIRSYGSYRWVGLYDVDHAAGEVRNVAFSGPSAPAYPTFPISMGLTSTAVANRAVVNVGDVCADSRYLTALDTSESEIIVPILDRNGELVAGTIDIESSERDAFDSAAEQLLQKCALAIQILWTTKEHRP